MLELTAAQSLIARITAIGLASAVFPYYLVKLLVKPFIDIRLANNPYRQFATNAVTAVLAVSVSVALQIIAGVFLPVAAPILEALLTAVIAAAVATFGHESIRNYGNLSESANQATAVFILNPPAAKVCFPRQHYVNLLVAAPFRHALTLPSYPFPAYCFPKNESIRGTPLGVV